MNTASYNSGATWGLEQYLAERQRVATFRVPAIRGFLAGCASGSEYLTGVLHGLALGAQYDMEQNSATIAGRA